MPLSSGTGAWASCRNVPASVSPHVSWAYRGIELTERGDGYTGRCTCDPGDAGWLDTGAHSSVSGTGCPRHGGRSSGLRPTLSAWKRPPARHPRPQQDALSSHGSRDLWVRRAGLGTEDSPSSPQRPRLRPQSRVHRAQGTGGYRSRSGVKRPLRKDRPFLKVCDWARSHSSEVWLQVPPSA